MSTAADGGDDVRKEMRAFIEDNFLYLDPDADLADDQELLAAGIVDSLGFVEIVEEVEARYAVGVQDVEITEENFGSVDAIARYVEAERPLDEHTGLRGRERRHAVLQLGQFVGEVRRQQVAPRRQHLAELDEDRPEPLQALAQPHAARRIQAPPDRHHAHERTHPALPERRQRDLVQAVA